jgi:hypothetical protein
MHKLLARSFYKSCSRRYSVRVVDMTLAVTSAMNPIVRAMRANVARRDNWAQIRIGACALLLPPLTLGAAFYSMLAAPDEGAARPRGTPAKTEAVRPDLVRDTTPARAVGPDLQSAAQATQQVAISDQPAPQRGVSASPPDARQQPPSGFAEDIARADSDPDRVTGAPLGKLDGSSPGARLAEPSWRAPAEASTALLPRGLVPPGKASSPMPPPRMTAQTSAARAPSAAAPSTEGPAASPPSARKHARSETAAAHRSTQPSEPAFSLKDWLQQLGIVPRNTRG